MPKCINPPLPTTTLEHARDLRRRLTDAERRLWQYLRTSRLNGLKFRRQHSIPPYIVDFLCASEHLVIELDGSQHTGASDVARTRFLEARGLRVLRFWDNDVLHNTDAVLEAILKIVENRTLTPTPLPMGEGL